VLLPLEPPSSPDRVDVCVLVGAVLVGVQVKLVVSEFVFVPPVAVGVWLT
jgi:hypothetical protein